MAEPKEIPENEIPLCGSCPTSFTESALLQNLDRMAGLLQRLRHNLACHPTEAELDRLNVVFERMYTGRQDLQLLYDRSHSMLGASVRRLPNEVLVHIFKLCEAPREEPALDALAPDNWEYQTDRELRRLAGGDLAAIAQVSTHWRNLVLSTPLLWTRITLDLRCWTIPMQTRRTLRVRRWLVELLHRALACGQQVPLTLEVSGVGECSPWALGPLVYHAHRWRSATFNLECDGSFLRLEKLSIKCMDEDFDTLEEVAQAFSDAPRLKKVEIIGPASMVAHMPIEQLQKCSVNGMASVDVASLVSNMGRLIASDLNIQLNFPSLTISSGNETGDSTDVVLAQLFKALTLPTLVRLHLHGKSDSGKPLQWPHSAALSLLRRSAMQNTLHGLVLHDVVLTERELLQCLGHLPQLSYLFVSDQPAIPQDGAPATPAHYLITDSLLERLTPMPDTPPEDFLVPNLAIVDFKTLGRFSGKALLNFVAARCAVADARCLLDVELEAQHEAASGNPAKKTTACPRKFECAVLWIPGYMRQFGEETRTAIDAYEMTGHLTLISREYDPEDDLELLI
ncbi:hypothetical protein B0H14DRAFT_3871257 [Mycena olivaceomarginata]|nr:hypothetical protein B0H14DRAFT_3871257 [Mycena olivaceomarginata]